MYWQPNFDVRLDALEAAQVATAASVLGLLGGGLVPLHANFVSPMNRWEPEAPFDDDVLRATIPASRCTVWGRVGDLPPGPSYSIVVTVSVKDISGAPLSLSCSRIEFASSPAIVPAPIDTPLVTNGLGTDYQSLAFTGTLVAADTPTRVGVVFITGGVAAVPSDPYRIRSMRIDVAEL